MASVARSLLALGLSGLGSGLSVPLTTRLQGTPYQQGPGSLSRIFDNFESPLHLIEARRTLKAANGQSVPVPPRVLIDPPRPQDGSDDDPPMDNGAEAWCIEVSFSYIRWDIWDPMYLIHNFSTGTKIGDFRFAATNIANDVQADCLIRNISLVPEHNGEGNVWHECSVPGTFFQFNLDKAELKLKGNWSCGSNPLKFTGEGQIDIPLLLGCLDEESDDSRLCLMSNSNVWPKLSSPVSIMPMVPQMPFVPWERSPLCSERSIDPAWQIDGLLFQHRFSHHKDKEAISSYSLDFDITNISNNERVHCVVLVDEMATPDTDHTARWLECGQDAGNKFAADNEVIFTEVMFDGDYSLLGVRQTWRCKDAVVANDNFTGVGYLVAPLQCGQPINQAEYDGDGWVVAGTSAYNCSLPSTTIDGYNSPPPTMPHTSYERSCTLNSFNATLLQLRGYEIEDGSATAAAAAPGAVGEVSKNATFAVYNPGSGDMYELWRVPVVADGAWHTCVAGDEELLPWQLMGCKYMLDRKTGQVGFQIQWYCDDRDPTNPILFSATASGKMPAEECGTSGKGGVCHLPVTSTGVDLALSSLTWSSTTGPMQRGPQLPWI